MNRKRWPLAALFVIAAIGVGCGSSGGAETGAVRTTGVTTIGAVRNTGNTAGTSTASKERVTHQKEMASPSSAAPSPSPAGLPGAAGPPPTPARHLPTQAPVRQQPGRLGSRPPSTQSTHEGRRHE